MKSNSWKKFLSVMLLLTMIVSMLPSAAFAEETQSADAQTVTEETVKVEETKDEVKETPKTETKETAKETPKTETKDETKTEVKDETKTEVKDEVKDEAKTEVKDETKDEVKDETKPETKDEVKDETKTEDKEEVKDEAEEEKDETEEYSEAVKAFLDAVAAISVPEDVSALSEDEVYGLLEQIEIAGGLYEQLSEEEQALDVVVAAVAKLNELAGYGVDTYANSSVPLTLTISSYGAPFINGSTGEHNVYTYKLTEYIERSKAGSDNASGSATARFIRSNETGWTLVVDIVVGNYTTTVTTNARITNKDMSAATGSMTFGMSFNTAGGVSTTVRISGGNPLPATQYDAILKYDGNGNGDAVTGVPASQSTKVDENKSATFTVANETPVRDGYTFKGWNTAANGSGKIYKAGDKIQVKSNTTTTLYAQWEEKAEEITVTYDPNFTGSKEQPVNYTTTAGSNYTVLENTFIAPDNKHFVNWNTDPDGNGTAYAANDVIEAIARSLTLYAQWDDNETPPSTTPNWSGLQITKTADPEVATPGENLTYTITVKNNTGVDLTDITVVDTLPKGVTFVSTSAGSYNGIGTVEVTIDSLAKGAEYSFTVTVKVDDDATGSITNTAEVADADGNGNKLADDVTKVKASVTTPVETKPGPAPDWDADLTITKTIVAMTDNTKVTLGDQITYKIVVKNTSSYEMKNIAVSDTLPASVKVIDAGDLTANGNALTGTIASLAAGASKEFTVIVEVIDISSDTITNTAKITGAECNGNVWNGEKESTVSTDVIQPLELSKTVDKTKATLGETVTYTITVTNNASTEKEVTVVDRLPDGITVNETTISNNGQYDDTARSISWTVKVPAKDNLKLTFSAVINADFIGSTIAANVAQAAADSVELRVESPTIEVTQPSETKESVPVKVSVEFKGLDDVSEVPTGYKLTGDAANDFLTGEINLGAATSRTGHIFKEYAGTAEVVLDKVYTLKFAQSGYEVEGYDCTPDVEFTVNKSAKSTDIDKTISVEVTLNYSKKGLETFKTVTVRTYFEGVTELPENFAYTLECLNAPKEAQLKGFQGPLTLTKGVDNGVPFMDFTATDVQLQTGYPISFSFKQDKYDIAGYTCTPGSGEFTGMNLAKPEPGQDKLTLIIRNVYTPLDPVDMPVTVNVYFKGLDAATKLPAYALRGVAKNEILNGSITPLVKDETANTAVYTGTVKAVPGKAYTLSFIQSNFDIDGYLCDASAIQQVNVTADKELGVVVNLTLNYTKVDLGKLTITKTANKSYATPGTTVRYTITVTNETGYDLTNVNVLDYLEDNLTYVTKTGSYDSKTSVALIPSLADGKSATFTISAKIKSGLSTGTVIENTAYVTSITIDGQKFDIQGLSDSAYITVTGGKGAPKTGDESNLGLWIAVMAASLACAGAAVVVYKKRRTGDD